MKKKNIIELEYNLSNEIKKQVIRSYTSKGKRFIAFAKHLLTYPFIRIWYNIRDWRTFLIFGIVALIVGSEVWIPYTLSFVFWSNETIRYTMISVGSAGLVFWNVVPCTPFIAICILLTIGIKTLINKIKAHKSKNQKKV